MSKAWRRLAAAILAALTARGTAVAANSARAEFVTMAVGARAAGMGEAFTAVADDATATQANPGGLGQVRGASAVAMYDVLGEGAGIGLLAGAFPLGPMTVGLGLTVLQFGAYDVRDAAGLKLGTDQVTDFAGTAGVAFTNPGGLPGWSGLSLEGVKETTGAVTVALGAGSVIPLGSAIRLGWAVAHVGPAADGFGPPAVVRAGGAWAPSSRLGVSAEGGFTLADRQPLAAVGLEFAPMHAAAIRAGYRWIGKAAPPGLTGVTAGAGVRLGSIGLDYAYQPFGELATTHRIAIVYGGRSRPVEAPPAVTTTAPAPSTVAPIPVKRTTAKAKPIVKRKKTKKRKPVAPPPEEPPAEP